MIVLDDADFTTMDAFPLRARFLAWHRGAELTDLAPRLRPLRSGAATALTRAAEARLRTATPAVTFRSDDAPFIVSERLRELPIAEATPIVVWWSSESALATEWNVFRERWGDFCYPAASDVCIWPADGAWILCYRRYEVFQFRAGS